MRNVAKAHVPFGQRQQTIISEALMLAKRSEAQENSTVMLTNFIPGTRSFTSVLSQRL